MNRKTYDLSFTPDLPPPPPPTPPEPVQVRGGGVQQAGRRLPAGRALLSPTPSLPPPSPPEPVQVRSGGVQQPGRRLPAGRAPIQLPRHLARLARVLRRHRHPQHVALLHLAAPCATCLTLSEPPWRDCALVRTAPRVRREDYALGSLGGSTAVQPHSLLAQNYEPFGQPRQAIWGLGPASSRFHGAGLSCASRRVTHAPGNNSMALMRGISSALL